MFLRNNIISSLQSFVGEMCVPVLPQVTCRHREKKAVPYLPNSRGICVCLRSERFKSEVEVLVWCGWRTRTLPSCKPGERAGSLSVLPPVSKPLQLFHVGSRVKHPEIKALTDIPAGRVHALWLRGLDWSPFSEWSKPRMCLPHPTQAQGKEQGQLPHLPVKNPQSSWVRSKPLSLWNTAPYTHISYQVRDKMKYWSHKPARGTIRVTLMGNYS